MEIQIVLERKNWRTEVKNTCLIIISIIIRTVNDGFVSVKHFNDHVKLIWLF